MRTQYFVVHHEGEWKVKMDGKHYGPYSNKKAATRAAVDAAHATGSNGGLAQVLVQGLDHNQFLTEWTYGKDPYPPPG